MKAILFYLFALVFLADYCDAQLSQSDVHDMAMGNAAVACLPPNSIPKNISLLTNADKTIITGSVLNNFMIKELSPVFISVSTTKRGTTIMCGAARLGLNSFSESYLEAGIAKMIGAKFSTAFKIQFHSWNFDDSKYDGRTFLIPTLSFSAEPIKNLCFGVIVLNPVRSRMSTIDESKLPAEINSGFSCRLSDKTSIAGAVVQHSNRPLSTHLGIEYNTWRSVYIRCGWHTMPVAETFGFGINYSRLTFDFALETHPVLGNSTSVALTFVL